MKKVLSFLLLLSRILYPRRCPICGRLLVEREYSICELCKNHIHIIQEPYCMKCGKPLAAESEEYCSDCQRGGHYFTEGRAAFPYAGRIKKSILNLKIHNCRGNAAFFAGAMAFVLKGVLSRWQIDVICPIPLHRSKRRYRGFNQAELLARPIGEALKIPVIPDLLSKIQETEEQKELDRKSRQKNLKKAFKIGSYDVKLKRVLLVDDIYTTGSTVDAAASILKDAGAEEVFFLTACIGTERDTEF